MNGLTVAVLVGTAVTLILGSAQLGGVIAAAMLFNVLIAGMAGVMVPLTLERWGADPAVASSIFVTMVTDSMGFLLFLGMATAAGLTG
jgi:magnesium transporter